MKTSMNVPGAAVERRLSFRCIEVSLQILEIEISIETLKIYIRSNGFLN